MLRAFTKSSGPDKRLTQNLGCLFKNNGGARPIKKAPSKPWGFLTLELNRYETGTSGTEVKLSDVGQPMPGSAKATAFAAH